MPQLTSDRSAQTLGAQFCAYPTSAGGAQVACDGSNINPVALALLNFKFPNGQYAVPSPQILLPSSGPGQMPIGESTFATPASYNEDQFTLNVDDKISEKNQFAARFFYSHAPTIEPFSPNAATVPGWGTTELDQNTMLVLSDTHVFNPQLVNIARFGYMRFDGDSAIANPILASDLGTQSPTGSSGGKIPAPGITIDGLFTVGDAGTPFQWQVTNSFIWQDTVSLTRRNHALRFGAEVKRHQVDVTAPFSIDGLLDIRTFSDFLLGQSAAQNGSPIGSSNVSLSNGSSGLFRKDERYIDFAAFVQDDIKLSSRLTLNAGLRYEIFGAPSDINGRLVTFDPTIATKSAPPDGTLSGFVVPSNFKGEVPERSLKIVDSGLCSPRGISTFNLASGSPGVSPIVQPSCFAVDTVSTSTGSLEILLCSCWLSSPSRSFNSLQAHRTVARPSSNRSLPNCRQTTPTPCLCRACPAAARALPQSPETWSTPTRRNTT